jgi:hypothetical protein
MEIWPISNLKQLKQKINILVDYVEKQGVELEQQSIKIGQQSVHIEQQFIRLEQQSVQFEQQSKKLEHQSVQIEQQSIHLEQQSTKLEQQIAYIDVLKKENDDLNRTINNLNDAFLLHTKDKNSDHWDTRFGYDNQISNLQLATVEQVVPGNRSRLSALKDTHKGERCFVIGNGPSLKVADLDLLKENGIFSFASKRISAIFEHTQWRPDVWGVSDLDFISLYHEEMSELEGFIKLAPCQSILNLNLPIREAIYYPFIQMDRTPCWFNQDVTRGVHFWGTITCKLINFAVYMGFTEIYLLGVDNSYPVKKDEDGRFTLDPSKDAHFDKNYYKNEKETKKAFSNIDDFEKSYQYMQQAYKDVKWFCDSLGVKVINATRGGELEIYPRTDFDHIFS